MNNLHREQELKLRQMFISPEFAILLRVIDSQVKQAQVIALRDAITSDVHPQKAATSQAAFAEAQRWHHAADILKKLSEQSEPFKVSQLE